MWCCWREGAVTGSNRGPSLGAARAKGWELFCQQWSTVGGLLVKSGDLYLTKMALAPM